MADGLVLNDTTYAGEAASGFIVKAITENETVKGGHAYVKDGIKKKFTIPRFDTDYEDLIQDRAATPTSKGSFTVDGKTLTPADYMIYMEFNPRDFEDHWSAIQLNPTLIDRNLPQTAESVLIQEVLKRHSRYANKSFWNNSTALAAPSIYRYYDGFIKKAADATTETNIIGSPATLTAANIQAKMQLCFDALPAALKYNPMVKFFLSYTDWDFYMQSQIAQTYKGVDITSVGVATFRGHPVVRIPDFPVGTILVTKGSATPESNLWIGMNSTDDASIQLSRLQNNSELWFIKMLAKVDVQFGWLQEVVLYVAP